jgi:hypothetical protein
MGGEEMSKVVVRKNLNRWFKEKWVDVSRRDKDGKHPPCGRSKAKKGSKGYPKCRPSVKVSSKTPKTSGQMTSGQKRAATKRKRSKKQGIGGKPTIVKQDYPFVAMAEDERQLPVPMHTNRPRSTHPGFSRTDVFQVPTGVGIPTAQAAPRTVPVMHAQGRTYPIADKEQYERALRAPDEETRRAAMNEVPRVMTQGVQSGQNIFRMPTFYGMPYNEETYFTTGEPMDLAFRLLKDDDIDVDRFKERLSRFMKEKEEEEEASRQRFLERKRIEEERRKNIMMGNAPRPFAEFSHEELESLIHDETGMQTPEQRIALFDEANTRNMENSKQFISDRQLSMGGPKFGYTDEFQDIHTGEPMDMAFRLLKTEGLLSSDTLAR